MMLQTNSEKSISIPQPKSKGRVRLRKVLKKRISTFFTYFILILLAIQTIFPILWMISGSFKSSAEFYSNIWGAPKAFLFTNYSGAWVKGEIGTFLSNSLLIVSIGLLILLICASFAAYALARLNFPGRQLVFWIILATMMVPPDVLTTPLFIIIKNLGLLNSYVSLSLVYAAGGFGLSVFLLRGYFITIPKELEEAMMIDGANRFQIFRYVILPLARPGFMIVLILQAMSMWNDLYLALVFMRSPEKATVPVGLLNFFERHSVDWPLFFAGLSIITIPILIIYLVAQRQFTEAMTSGALKG